MFKKFHDPTLFVKTWSFSEKIKLKFCTVGKNHFTIDATPDEAEAFATAVLQACVTTRKAVK